MVGRGGGRKTGTHKIAPGMLKNCLEASRKNKINKQNVTGMSSNNVPFITDEIAYVVAKNIQRQRKACVTNIFRATGSLNMFDHDSHLATEHEDNVGNTMGGHALNSSTQHDEDEQASQGFIPPITESLLGKRRRESNFISRIEAGLQLNKALDPSPRENVTRSEVEQANDDEIGVNTATSKTKGRGKRGVYKSYIVDMKIKGKGSKLPIFIPDDIDHAIGENTRHLVNEYGRVVRTKAPFNVKNWNEAFKAVGDIMWKEIQERFEITQCGDYARMYLFVVETMQRLYRLYKCRLHYHYKKCGKTDDERKKNPPPDFPPSQWDYLCKHYGSDQFKIISARNSKNRKSDKRVKHTTGTLSFPKSEDILTKRNANVKPKADVIWLIQHTHKNVQGQLEWPIGDIRSKEIHENLKNVVSTAGESVT